jgi:predicted nucleotidyltransferase
MSYQRMLQVLKRPDSAVFAAFRVGSRVYGTASEGSDEDFVAVLGDRKAKQDLAFASGVNVVIHGLATFEQALADHSLFALECLFAPAEHRLKEAKPAFAFKLNKRKLLDSAQGRSDADFAKAKKRFVDERGPSTKKLFHSLRVLMFARQVASKGRIVDFTEAAPLWTEMRNQTETEAGWDDFERNYGPRRDALLEELRRLAPTR